MTPHIQTKIHTQNCLHRIIHQNQQEWTDACREATKAINEAKTESWKDHLQVAVSNSDGRNIWKVIQGLNGTPDANFPNKVMSHDGWTITDIKSKANIFINHHARVSKLNMLQGEWYLNQQFKKHFNAPSVDNESCTLLQMGELLFAIKKMKGKGAPGPDNIPPSFLKSLGHLALLELLSIYNSSFSLALTHASGALPRSFHYWKLGNLLVKLHLSVPSVSHHVLLNFWNAFLLIVFTILLKPTTCSVDSKLVFIKVRAVRITQIVQAIEDGFQQCPMQCSTLTIRLQQSIRYGLERKIVASHVRHWYPFYIHLLDSIFLQRPQSTGSTL